MNLPELTSDQILALAYMPAPRREAVRALWQLDAALAAAALSGREPMIRRIKLTWWREALERLDTAPPPAEPTLEAVATRILPLGITGADLSRLEEGWACAADDDDRQGHEARGRVLFDLTARLLGQPADAGQLSAGEGWALIDLAHRTGNSAAPDIPDLRWPPRLRPLGMLAVLARDDALHGPTAQGSPRRMLRMLRHRLTGR